MLNIEKTVTASPEQWMIAIEGARNAMNSWNRIDSYIEYIENPVTGNRAPWQFHMGENDDKLLRNLNSAGSEHAKFKRMLPVTVTLAAPMYLFKELDTYKVATVRNSTSTMHKIHAKEFTLDDFSVEHLNELSTQTMEEIIYRLNKCRDRYLVTKDKDDWWQMIQLLPSSYNQKSTLYLNYEVLSNIYKQRRHHKLDCWHTFCDWIETLPYSYLITGDLDDESIISNS